ncbi:hypothetical protein MCAP1_003450 [Malassezia caprae]|uniref:Uncharacterized protein n=1 Tax=Malassezia caprae TaxID=1381934 RepID=A0AAF0IWU9_9BASI|nr:hypothetical protein MCAP1_003450 [Malassezia caprae]
MRRPGSRIAYDTDDINHILDMLESRPRPWNVSEIARTLSRERPAHTYYSYQFFLQQNLRERLNLVHRLEERQAERGTGTAPTALRLQPRTVPPVGSMSPSSLSSLDELYEEAQSLHEHDASTSRQEDSAQAAQPEEESEEEEMDEEAVLAFEALRRSRTDPTEAGAGASDAPGAHEGPTGGASGQAAVQAPAAAPTPAPAETATEAPMPEAPPKEPVREAHTTASEDNDALFEDPDKAGEPPVPAAHAAPQIRAPRVPLSQEHEEQLVDALVHELEASGTDAASMDTEAQLDAPIPAHVLERVADACVPPRPALVAWQQYAELHARTLWQTALDRWSLAATPEAASNDASEFEDPTSPAGSESMVDAALAGALHTPESQAIPPQYTPHSVRVGQRTGHHDAKVSARAHLERIPPEAPSPTVERHAAGVPTTPRRVSFAEERMARALYEARIWELCADYGLASPRQLVPFLLPVGGDVDRCRRRMERHMRRLAQRYEMDVGTLIELLAAQHGDLKQLTTVLDIQQRGRTRRQSTAPSAST